LDEFTLVTGHHRKHAMRLLRAGPANTGSDPRPSRRVYGEGIRVALIVIWEASDRICGKRLRPLVPVLVASMERHGHLQLAPEVRSGLLAMSAATIDRALREVRGRTGGRPRRRSPPSAAVKRSVAVRTFDGWDDPAPGFMEADLVAHSGPTSKGSYVQTLTLTLTDIATGWTECAPVLVREQKLLTEVVDELRKVMPFALLGFDTDNDSVFMNETVLAYCQATGVEFTRCRPYRKNDQAWVEQKNGAVVRHTVGYRRYEGLEAAAALAMLYRSLRFFVNFFQPSFKLAEKSREGAKVKKRYHAPATPHQRLMADSRIGVGADPGRGHLRHPRSGALAERNPRRSAASRRDCGSSGDRRVDQPDGADAGAISLGPAHGVARRRGAPNEPAEGEDQARPATPRPTGEGDSADARLVRGGAVADVTGVP
jgi:hypothetical protein